ncbi:MAG: dynamin family protein [Methylococcales bacterium]|nr:dynamin family protein [Methylococcales bacterium]
MKSKNFQLNLPRFMDRLKIMNDNILEHISKETLRLISLLSNTFKEVLEIQNLLNANAAQQEKTIGVEEVKKWMGHLENERQKLEKMEVVLAVIGTMKAGKSTTINAIVGMEILPNRETAMTTLPTLIRNVHGQQQPILKIRKIAPLQKLSVEIANKLKTLSESEIKQIDLHGIEDGKSLIEGLRHNGVYHFKTEYEGQEGIFEFLKHLNDIMRLAKDKIIDIAPPYGEYEQLDDLPVLEVEFCHLNGMENKAHGSLAILDTPGPNEFGQSETLRRVFKTQLEKASAILLVIDFTQMNTESENNVRLQLAEIKEQLSKDSLHVIVNKFDNADANCMTKDWLLTFVAEMVEIETSRVFPISAKTALLANRARRHLEHNNQLPDYVKEPWVVDFANKALGTLWKKQINKMDKEDFQECIDSLWEDSFFKEPIEKVIEKSHATAASKSLDSAIYKLDYYNTECLNMLSIRSNTMISDIEDVKQMMQGLQFDISRCQVVKLEIDKRVKQTLTDLENEMASVMEVQWQSINDIISKFFKDGKKMENKLQEQQFQLKLKKRNENHTIRRFLRNFVDGGDKYERKEIKEKISQRFDPASPEIVCGSASAANTLTTEITTDIVSIFENADYQLKLVTNDLIKSTGMVISEQINSAVEDTLTRAKEKLKDKGIETNFSSPSITLSIENVNTSALFSVGYQEKTETKTAKRYKDSLWGSICRNLGTSEWGRESYLYNDTTYKVDIAKIKTKIIEQLESQRIYLSNQTESYLTQAFQPKINEHLKNLEEYLERYLGVLADGMKSSELDQHAKLKLKQHLEILSKEQKIMKQDINVVKATSLNGA